MSFWTKLAASSQSSIFAAVKKGDLEKVKALLKGNPDLVFIDDGRDGWTPLHYAAHWGHKDIAELLLASKAEVNARANDSLTPLHIAAAQDYKDVAELLLANKAEVNARDDDDITPLHFAADGGYKDVVELVRQHGGHE